MRVSWHDDLYRYQPRVMEFGRWRIGRWVAARVTAWAVWVATFLPLFVASRALLHVPPLQSALWAGVLAAGTAYVLANFLNPETPARGWGRLLADEARCTRAVLTHRRPAPARIDTTHIRRHQEK